MVEPTHPNDFFFLIAKDFSASLVDDADMTLGVRGNEDHAGGIKILLRPISFQR